MDCIFCRIVAGEIPCYKLAETPVALAFLDIMPLTRGHALVIPKRHVELAYKATPAMMAEVMSLATRVADAIARATGCEGMNLLLNCGKLAGQVVPHAHLHIIPRYANDNIRWPWPAGKLAHDTATELCTAIKGHLA